LLFRASTFEQTGPAL